MLINYSSTSFIRLFKCSSFKKAMKKCFIIQFFILFSVCCFGQESKMSEVVVNIAEELAADESDPEIVGTYIEQLYELAENPVKLNSANENEISRLFFLSDFQVKALAEYAHSSGKIISIFEIANIPGFDNETAKMLIPLITLDNGIKMNSDSVIWKNTFLTNISFKPGNDDTISLGPPLKILTKYKFTAGSFSGGFTLEKDPGEKLLSGNPPLPDFWSANLSYNGRGIVRKLIIGDYSARFGQGTNINTGIRTGLSLTAPGYMSASDDIRPYTSTAENNFFRGVSSELSFKNLGLFLFYSENYSDATLGSSSDSLEGYIESFYLAGTHNTSSTLLKKDAISELVYGINLSYNFNNIMIGLTWSEDKFSLPVNSASSGPSDAYDFEGDRNNLYTFYYNGLINRFLLYGEFSSNEYKKFAFVQGLSVRPSDRLTINFLFRNYSPGYVCFHGKGPGSSSTTGNEKGILGNFNFEAAKHLFISGGADVQNFPWLKYQCSSPSWGIKQELRVRFLPTERLTFESVFNNRSSIIDNREKTGIPEQKQINSKGIRGSVRYSFTENLTLGTRIDYKRVDPSGNTGILLLQDMKYRLKQLPLTIWIRYCIFNTDAWDSRLYTYENDLLYSFSIPALSGEGSRSYLMAKWEISDIAELRVKYGLTSLKKSGNFPENIDEVKLQFRVWF